MAISMQPSRSAPLCISMHSHDNVAIVVADDGLAAGTQIPHGPALLEKIPQAHKVALCDIGKGQPVTRYGHTIAFANRTIRAGAWVREEMLDVPQAPPLDELPLATAAPPPQPALSGYT